MRKEGHGFTGESGSDGKGCGGGGRRGVADVEDVPVSADVEIIEQPAVAVAGLGADAGAAGLEVGGGDFGDETLKGLDEGAFAERSFEFAETGSPVFAGDDSEAGPKEGFERVPQVELGLAVGFTAQGEHGVGSAFDAALDHAGEMDSEKGKGRIGYRIDEIANEAAGMGFENVVFASEGCDAQGQVRVGLPGETVGVEPAARDKNPAGPSLAVTGDFDTAGFGAATNGDDFLPEDDFASETLDFFGVLGGDGGVIDDSGLGHPQPLDPGAVGFDLADFVGGEGTQAIEAVGDAAATEFLESRQFKGVGGDDNFATNLVRDGFGTAEVEELLITGSAVGGFETSGFVVEAGVDDAAVVSGLMAGRGGFLFDEDEPGSGSGLEQFECGGEADDATADDEDIKGHGIRGSSSELAEAYGEGGERFGQDASSGDFDGPADGMAKEIAVEQRPVVAGGQSESEYFGTEDAEDAAAAQGGEDVRVIGGFKQAQESVEDLTAGRGLGGIIEGGGKEVVE